MQNIQYLTWVTGLILCGAIFILINSFFQKIDESETEQGWFCGTNSRPPRHYLDERLAVDYALGKHLFRNNCASCHNIDMKSDLTGPALRGSMKMWNNDTSEMIRYIQDSPEFLSITQNKRILQIHKDFGRMVAHEFNLSKDELKVIIAYIEMQY